MKTRRAAPTDGSRQPGRPASETPAVDDPADSLPGDVEGQAPGAANATGSLADRVDLTGLSIAGITRRRVGWVAAGLLAIWIVIVFARQVGDATTVTNQAIKLSEDNAALAAEVKSLQSELQLIVQPDYVAIAARGHGLGTDREIPFTLDPSVPDPGPNAPGSASTRVGVRDDRVSPLESWLSLLFGPTD